MLDVSNRSISILIVDNDKKIREGLSTKFISLGYTMFLASTGKEGLNLFTKEQPDLIILDLLLPDLNGNSFCRKIREKSQVSIIIITALDNISDRIIGLESGADDYIVKPFSPKELEVRIKNVLKRTNKELPKPFKKSQNVFYNDNLAINIDKKSILYKNVLIKLTNIEFTLLRFLIENSGKVLSRKIILDNIWGYIPERDIDTRVVDVYISRLRSKIEENSTTPNFILTVRGTGYMFQKY
jgi:OmpR family response regulator RpaB